MNVILHLPLTFWLIVTAMTVLWHVKNKTIFRQNSSQSLRLAQVDLMGVHTISLIGLLFLSLGVPVWESPKIQNAWSFWLVAGLLVFFFATIMKVRAVNSLPDDLWHFTERNRLLVARGRIVRFHLENDFAALVPMLALIWIAHHFG